MAKVVESDGDVLVNNNNNKEEKKFEVPVFKTSVMEDQDKKLEEIFELEKKMALNLSHRGHLRLWEQHGKKVESGVNVAREIVTRMVKENTRFFGNVNNMVTEATRGNDASHTLDHFRQVSFYGLYVLVCLSTKSEAGERAQGLFSSLRSSPLGAERKESFDVKAYVNELEKSETFLRYRWLVYLCCFTHDVIDHKYAKDAEDLEAKISTVRKTLEELEYPLKNNDGDDDVDIVLNIIDNISFSKRAKGQIKEQGKHEWLRQLVSDADQLDAEGYRGLMRLLVCAGRMNNSLKNIIEHMDEKILKLDEYLYYPISGYMCEELMVPVKACREAFKISEGF